LRRRLRCARSSEGVVSRESQVRPVAATRPATRAARPAPQRRPHDSRCFPESRRIPGLRMSTSLRNPFRQAHFVLSAPELRLLPRDAGAEIAFAGRSNAGKSSALNAICDQTGLARTSKTPGRTQQFVIFALDDARRLVDLPGYGYAKVPEALRAHWRKVVDAY